MKQHLETDFVARHYCPGASTPNEAHPALVDDFAMIFKELFCVAADSLASHLHQPLDRLGVLFEEPIGTGTIARTNTVKNLQRSKKIARRVSQDDLETALASSFFGKGQFLFVVRKLGGPEVENLAALGYRFARVGQISEVVSKSMQIEHARIENYLERMRDYSVTENLMAAGVFLSGFLLRPKIQGRGFDVLVKTEKQNQLPTTQLPYTFLEEWQIEMLRSFNDRTAAVILQDLVAEEGWSGAQRDFRWHLLLAVGKLVELMGDPTFLAQAIFSAKESHPACQSTLASTARTDEAKCTLFSFRMMASIYDQPPNDSLTYVPLRFFNAQQQVSTGVSSHDHFVEKAKQEFAHCHGSVWSRVGSTDNKPSSLRESLNWLGTASSTKPSTPRSLSINFCRDAARQSYESRAPLTLDSGVNKAGVEVHEVDAKSIMEKKDIPFSREREGSGRGRPEGWIDVPTWVDELYSLFLQDQS